jgi:hypothetical protein
VRIIISHPVEMTLESVGTQQQAEAAGAIGIVASATLVI